ncbi:MAG: undecaprenyl-phosphate glucose phosphotransferase [Bacteroidales bacterium]|nr:undecaprenyl-phosphate glucose phosphotransferase [Bacteroidales bacterium]
MIKKGYGKFINKLVVLGEFFIINILFFLLLIFPLGEDGNIIFNKKEELLILLNLSYLPTLFFQLRKFHEKRIISVLSILINSFKVSAIFFISSILMFVFFDFADLSKNYIIGYFVLYYFVLTGWWMLTVALLRLYRKKGKNFKNVVIVGNSKNAFSLALELSSVKSYGYRVLGYFAKERLSDKNEFSFLGSESEIVPFLKSHKVDELYCCLNDEYSDKINKLIEYCENHFVRFFLIPPGEKTVLKNMKIDMVGSLPVLATRKEPLNNSLSKIIKRSFDIIFSIIVILLSPLWLIPISIAVKLSSRGPVFFKQERTGIDGRNFYCYKFRSMYVNDLADVLPATKDDPRKTKIGDFLRKTSLDELPQFFNVLKGDMSVVGPRPHMIKQTEAYADVINKYRVRLYIKPGITGWAQINGYRGETKEKWQMEKRVEYDLWYLENWSFPLDMKIILKTSGLIFHPDSNVV